MKYFFPDSQDQVDPNFDFINESHLIHRIRQRDDYYAHEALGTPPFDGILLSLAIIDGVSNSGHYNSSARIRLRREGINNFFRINQSGATISTLGDCGAFAYVKHDVPPFSVNQVLDFNEKKTDVNIASDMINGAWLKTYDQAVLCSNDSDLEGALRSIKEHHPHIRIGLVAPISGDDPRKISTDLAKFSDWKKILSTTHLSRSQLPDRIPSSHLSKPSAWKN
jgi:uncharacterized LabA/DUF88 family protein